MAEETIVYKNFIFYLSDNNTTIDIMTPEGYAFDWVHDTSEKVVDRAKKLVDNRLSTPAVSNMEVFARMETAMDRYLRIYDAEQYAWLETNAAMLQEKDSESILELVCSVTMGLCQVPHYNNTPVTNLLALFTLIESPILSRMVITYINRFK